MHVLLNPGPVNVSPRVRAALSGPDLCHREAEYFDLQDAIRARLPAALGADPGLYAPVMITGSGTAIVEATVASSVPDAGRLLVVRNGVYGDRIARMAAAHGIAHDTVDAPWTERPNLEAVEAALNRARYDALAIVHHETTTGLLNDLGAVSAIARDRGARLIVDAVSSLGGETFDFDRWQPDAVACTANKCVQGLPGISFVLLRRDFLDEMSRWRERSVYLHLPRHQAEQARRSTPFTPAIQIAFALAEALDELIEETVTARIARYGRAAAIVRDGLEALGLRLLLPPRLRSNTLTAAALPDNVSYDRLHDALKQQGFVIYAGQGPLSASCFRVANMGHVVEADYRRFISALAAVVP